MRQIWIVNGPNLNLLGQREPGIYGSLTLPEIEAAMTELGRELGLAITCFQDNSEGALVDLIQQADLEAEGVVLNAAAYTHTSVALRDAVLAVKVPVLEVHLSNPHARDTFRHHSYLAGAAVGCIMGFGPDSYALALHWFARNLGA